MSEHDIFLALLDLPDTAARVAYLDKACAGHGNLRARVEALFRSHETAGCFLARPAVMPLEPDLSAAQAPLDFRRRGGNRSESARNRQTVC